ncbi:MAG: ATP-binding protein [Muribaculaceae bacterium]|nr:ATP-binding protein [Muribaculaceae bacterium]
MEKKEKYGVGQQDFRVLRTRDCVYVDKTKYIEKIVHSGSQYYFLARPRRFGKSLFLSTLQYFFEGRRELFKGLYIDGTDWDWKSYPVLRLDLNMERYAEPGKLDDVLDNVFRGWEAKYGVICKDTNPPQRFRSIIEAVHDKTGMPVVILVDEYDKPLVSNLNREENYEHYREKLASLYSNFKSSAEHIRLVFLTGVSRFSKLSVFSDLNNLRDITFEDDYADICGITERELQDNFKAGVAALADKEHRSYEDILRILKENFDGYRFSRYGSEIYNPWSLLNSLDTSEIAFYWNRTGMPTIVVESLQNIDADLEEVLNTQCTINTLLGLDLKSANPLALLYQTGYLTIKDYDRDEQIFTLGVPNREVKEGLFDTLLPFYVKVKQGFVETVVFNITKNIRQGNPEKLMSSLQTYFAGIPYGLKMDNENNFQNAFYILMSLIGIKVSAEVSTSNGRIDILLETPKYIYIIELKYDGTAEDALRQIEERLYARPYQNKQRKIFKIGVSFSSKTRCIEDWKIAD